MKTCYSIFAITSIRFWRVRSTWIQFLKVQSIFISHNFYVRREYDLHHPKPDLASLDGTTSTIDTWFFLKYFYLLVKLLLASYVQLHQPDVPILPQLRINQHHSWKVPQGDVSFSYRGTIYGPPKQWLPSWKGIRVQMILPLSHCMLWDVHLCRHGARCQCWFNYIRRHNYEDYLWVWILPHMHPRLGLQVLWHLPWSPWSTSDWLPHFQWGQPQSNAGQTAKLVS